MSQITEEQWEIQKIISRVASRWDHYNSLGILSFVLFILTVADIVGIMWITSPKHPHVAYWLLVTADTVFWMIGILLIIGFLTTAISSAVYRKQSRAAMDKLLVATKRIVVVDVAGRRNKCTVVHLHNGQRFTLRWVPKRDLSGPFEEFCGGNNYHKHIC